jgi:ATP-binding cassette subfamily F protein 3
VLALIAYQRPNLLLLDEPTNHLDLEMRQALSVALQDYEGAVVLVSHDRHLLSTVADAFLLVHGGRALPFDGDLSDYARWLSQEGQIGGSAAAGADAPATVADVSGTAEGRKERRRLEAQRRASLSPLREAVTMLERELERLAGARTRVEGQLAEAANDAERPRLAQLLREQGQLVRAIEAAEAAWLRASERLEAQRDSVQ